MITPKQEATLLRAARAVRRRAHAPYSKYRVGAAVLDERGRIHAGCNVENASYGLTNCAERTAIFAAVAESGPRLKIQAIAVLNAQGTPCAPCGACRQVLAELGNAGSDVILAGPTGAPKRLTLGALLPLAFALRAT